MSRMEMGRFRPVPDHPATIRQLEAQLAERDTQVLSLQAEVRRLTALLPRDLRKSHPKPTRREKVAMNGAGQGVSHANA